MSALWMRGKNGGQMSTATLTQRIDQTEEFVGAMDALQELALKGTAQQREAHPKRKPTWAPGIAFSKELEDKLRPYYNDCDVPYGRLWTEWDRWNPSELYRFNLRVGSLPNGRLLLSVWFRGKTSRGDRDWWLNNSHNVSPEIHRLAVEELFRLAQSPDEVLKAGAVLSGICYMCFRKLTDPQSRQRGIGPECFGKVRTDDF
jgi:hypothetical protein